jgi:hypothetical protein
VSELRPALDCCSEDHRKICESVGAYRRWGLVTVGILVVALAIGMTIETTAGEQSPWAWGQLLPEVRWHRVLAPVAAWWAGCFFYAVIAESRRLSLLTGQLRPVDLRPLLPFTGQALGLSLLVLGSVAVYLLIPLVSWSGGAVVERVIDRLLE